MVISHQDDTMRQINVGVWSLVMGFMFLAGALGLLAIRSTAATEGRRQIARFVDGMNHLSDGLIALNKNGRIMGANPAGRRLFQETGSGKQASDIYGAFPGLTRQDGELLISSGSPREIYVDSLYPGGLRALRFRSQPSEGIVLLLVSDVTESRLVERRRRQIAQLQLVGRIAGGVANDFSDILCAISGHSALLRRPDMEPAARSDSLDMIARETRRGALLSRMLLDLSRSGESENVSQRLAENVKEAVSLLRVALSPEWTIRSVIRGEYPAVPLGSSQVEQVVLNLGLFAADAQHQPGAIIITLSPPSADHLLEVGSQFAAVILISAHGEKDREELPADGASAREAVSIPADSRVILSVVQSMVEESGGRVDYMSSPDGSRIYRVCLPSMDMPDAGAEFAGSLALVQEPDVKTFGGVAPAVFLAVVLHDLEGLGLGAQELDENGVESRGRVG